MNSRAKTMIAAAALCLGIGAPSDASAAEVAGVEHVGHLGPDGSIEWVTEVVNDYGVAEVYQKVYFERPLGDGWSLEQQQWALRDERRRLIGLKIPDDNYQPRYQIKMRYDGRDGVVLPAIEGRAPERYWLDNAGFEPVAGGSLHKRIGMISAQEFPERDRDELESLFGEVPTSARPVIYSYELSRGGAGLVTAETDGSLRARVIWYGAGGLAGCILLVLVALRWLRDDARAEAADAYLKDLDDRIEGV